LYGFKSKAATVAPAGHQSPPPIHPQEETERDDTTYVWYTSATEGSGRYMGAVRVGRESDGGEEKTVDSTTRVPDACT